MNKKIKCFILFIFAVFLCFPYSVLANNGGHTSGGVAPGDGKNCPECEWTYNPRAKAVRVTIYRYDGKSLSVRDSKDYCASSDGCGGYAGAFQTTRKTGKVAYQSYYHEAPTFANGYSKPTIFYSSTDTLRFSDILTASRETIENQVINLFSLNSQNSDTILSRLKSEFVSLNDLSKSDLSNIYITIEPTFYIAYKNQSLKYYGTIYELAYYFQDVAKMEGLNEWVFYNFPRTVMATSQTVVDKKGFVGNFVSLTYDGYLNGNPWTTAVRQANAKKIISQAGVGINVFWLGNYVPSAPSCSISESGNVYTLTVHNNDGTLNYDIGTGNLSHNVRRNSYTASFKDQKIIGQVYNSNGTSVATCELKRKIPTCKETCSSNDLGCMENYCQVMTNNSSQKKECITTCGYSDPGFGTCKDNGSKNGNDTVCDANTSSKNSTCINSTKNTYYVTTCEENNTITYGNSLPVTVSPGTGFSYTPILSGNKSCKHVFDVKKWEFDYAASYTANERNTLKGKLNAYNTLQNSTWNIERFQYSSSKGTNISIDIAYDNNPSSGNRKTTKKLVVEQKDINNNFTVSAGGSSSVTMYESPNKTTQSVYSSISTNSSNRSTYKLPAVCIAVGSGDIYEPTNNKCKSSSEGPYYDYYTNLKIKVDSYDTKATITKEGTALNVTNTCNYNVNAPVSCAIVYKDGTYELRIENKNSVPNISYGLSFSQNSLNGQKSYTGGLDRTLYGTVAIGSQIVATCKALSNVPDNSTCGGFLPAEYDKIKSYCATSWMNDVVGFSSEKDCINYCGAGSNTCKNNPEIDNTNLADVTKFCTNASSRSEAGYNNKIYNNPVKDEKHNITMCINDCMDMPKSNDCLGITCDYIYRPISLRDPFPNNRRPGYNWYGKEIYITDDLLNPVLNPNGAEPEYVISLNKDRMDTINKDTDTYNATKGNNAYLDYVYIDENNKSNAYVSKFIHQRGESKGGYNNYFTGGTLVNK